MAEARDIVAVSVPFAAGIAAASLIGHPEALARLSGIVSAVLFFIAALRQGRTAAAVLPLYFCLGLMCFSSRALYPTGAGISSGAGGEALERLSAVIEAIPFPGGRTNSMIKALLTGDRSDLSGETVRAFRASGASHILALSGLHLGVIYGIILKAFAFLGNSRPGMTAKSILTVSACGFYTLMTGAGPSTVRAFLFICLNEAARLQPGRKREPVAVLCTALTVQLALSPEVISSVGFQLSYLAMLGIFMLYPVLNGWYPASGSFRMDRLDPVRKTWSSMALTLSCQAFTAPLAWYRFGTFPEYFLLTNLIALPITEGLMLCAVACTALHAMEACPDILTRATDVLASALIFCLEVIAGM